MKTFDYDYWKFNCHCEQEKTVHEICLDCAIKLGHDNLPESKQLTPKKNRIVVWKDGSHIFTDVSWEYENDENWLTTIIL